MQESTQKIVLSKEKRQEMIGQIQDFFRKERDEELGNLAADIFLDFVIDKLSTEFYNQGISDSYAFFDDKLPDLLELKK